MIDNITVTGKEGAEKELIPIARLKDFLVWREKEFLEKYEGKRYDTCNDTHSSLEAILSDGQPLVAIMNSTLLNWDSKASHPWIMKIEIQYDGNNNNGMPDDVTYQKMNAFEELINNKLIDADGYLNVGRVTAENTRSIFIACKEFRLPSKTLFNLIATSSAGFEINYSIFKDKYWQTLEKYQV
jgi:hypothetical protein